MQGGGGGALIIGFKVAFTCSTHENAATTPLFQGLLCKLFCLEGGGGGCFQQFRPHVIRDD